MPASTSRVGLLLGAALIVLSAGCGGSKAKLTFAEVEGTVTMNGRPVPGAEVTFYPMSESNEGLPSATARTDEAGKYRLVGTGPQPGAVVGKSRVVVNWPPHERSEDAGAQSRKNPFDIPVRYSVASQTPLQVEVKAPGPNTIDVTLEPK